MLLTPPITLLTVPLTVFDAPLTASLVPPPVPGSSTFGALGVSSDGISVPLHYLNPTMRIPLVPVTMNCTVPPIPTPARAYEVGAVFRELVRAFPGRERVAVIATGGLSHEPGGPRYFWVDEEFDLWFLDLLKRGDHTALLRECTLERMEAAGSGGTAELLAWILALAFTTGPADVLAYMPAIAWRSGTGMVTWSHFAA